MMSTREALDRAQQAILDQLVELSSMVEQATLDAVESLRTRDFEASKRIYANDDLINKKRFEIETETITAIATQQPMATDLRLLASVLELCTELERMGDYAKGIAKINLRYGEEELLKPLIDIPKMAEIATKMLHDAIAAFVRQDMSVSGQICSEDDKVDALYEAVYHELIGIIAKDPSTAEKANYLLWAAHNIERLADRVILKKHNIFHYSYYMIF